jgi:hypothetical protein
MPRVENDTVLYPYSLQYEQIKHLEIVPEELARLSQEQAQDLDRASEVAYGKPYFVARRGESWIVRKREASRRTLGYEGDTLDNWYLHCTCLSWRYFTC